MALLLSLFLAFSHLDVRIFHQMIRSDIRGYAMESAVIFVKPHGCGQIAVLLDGPQTHTSQEPAYEDKTHRFEYRELTVGEYQVVVGCLDNEDREIQVIQAGVLRVV